MWLAALFLSLALLALAIWLAARSQRGRREAGLPRGRIVYADTDRWSTVAQPYFSKNHGLTGKPDYLVDTPQGRIPVEVKGGVAPPDGQAYPSHVMQLAAYCLLLEEAHGEAPPYGLIHYADATLQVDYTPRLRSQLLALLAAMRAERRQRSVGRSHQEPARCRACGVRHACGDQALG